MAYFITTPTRVGRSQGASIFWGLISVCFAFAACFYYYKNIESERNANQMRDQVLQQGERIETLNSQKDHLEASKTESEAQLKTREDLIQEKEAQLAQEETALEGMGRQTQSQVQQNLTQVTMVRKFNDIIRKLGASTPSDVVERGGRPVLRLPNAQLFAPGDAALKPEGSALLTQITQALGGQLDSFELRVVSYTDTEAEAQPADKAAKKEPASDPHAASWQLTASRAASLLRFFRDQTQVPFLNVMASGRGDCEPIVPNNAEGHARNRRVEITVTPLPVPFHPPEGGKSEKAATNPSSARDTGAPDSSPTKKTKKPDKTPGN